MDIGLCLFLADRQFRLGHLEISFGICSILPRPSFQAVAGDSLREVTRQQLLWNKYRHRRKMLWISRNQTFKALGKGLDEHVSNRAFRGAALMLGSNVGSPQIVRCLRVPERPQGGPLDPHFGKELSLKNPITVKRRSQLDICDR
jgi:hypothetical protein